MAEMLIKSESLTSIADKIRVLSGTTDAMGLDDMSMHVGEANENIDTEASLISQIAAALEGKTSGVELPKLTNEGTASDLALNKQLIDADGNVIEGNVPVVEETGYAQWDVDDLRYDEENNRLELRGISPLRLYRSGSGVRMYCDGELLGNATPEHVAKGMTFTSAAGLLVEGTLEVGTPETWTLTFGDGSTVEKVVYVK